MRVVVVVLAIAAASCAGTTAVTTTQPPTGTPATTSTTTTSTTTTATVPDTAGPTGRRGHGMTALGHGRLLIAGGWTVAANARTWLGDTWVFDTSAGEWTELGSIPQRGQHALAAGNDQVVLFGGYVGGNEVYSDVRMLDGEDWERITDTGPVPEGRAGAVMAYDDANGLFVLFGGDEEPFDARIADGETWTFDGSAWVDVAPDPSPQHLTEGHPVLFELAMAYDVQSRRMILLIGGDETWAFDTTRGMWERRTAPDSAADFMIAAAYHQGLDRVITYGGAPTEATGETWAYDYDTDTWELIPTAVDPGPLGDHAMAYDPATDSVYLFGGTRQPLGLDPTEPALGELWRFDGDDWALVWAPES